MSVASRLLCLILMVALARCGSPALVNESSAIDQGIWRFDDSRSLEVQIEDTISPFHFYFLVRNGGNYAYQNLIIYFKTYYPNNTYTVDTIDCPLSDASGKWLGSGLGDMLDNRIMFKRNVQFTQSGKYNFEIQHAMRQDTISEIYDVGLLIEKAAQ